MSDIIIQRGDGSKVEHKKFKFKVLLDNLRSARNVGAIFRSSDAAGANELILCGTTAIPPHKGIEQTAMGAEKYVNWSYSLFSLEACRDLKKKGIPICVLETTSKSKSLWNIEYPEEMLLVLGNEANGISEEIVKLADFIIEIPMHGYKNSLNVASAYSVIVYEMLRQWNSKTKNKMVK